MKGKAWRNWSSEEIAIIKRYYKVEGKSIMARLPKRTWRAIRAKALKLSFHLRGRKSPNWTKQELHRLQELRKTKSVSELMPFFPGRTLNALWVKCERRIMIYNSYGYKTLIIWDDEMSDEKAIAQKIINFDKVKSK